MKAIVYREYVGPDVLRYEEADKPVPKDDKVLTKVMWLQSIHLTGDL